MYQQNVRIPTLLALVLVASLSVGGFFAYDRASSFLGTAKTTSTIPPENVEILNIADTSFVVAWTTNEPVAATVHFGDELSKIAYDIRDSDQVPKQYRTHYIPVTGVEPSSEVPVEIRIGETGYVIDPVATAPRLTSLPQSLPLYGTVHTATNEPSAGAIVRVTLQDDTVWATFNSGTTDWILPTAPIRTTNGTSYLCETHNCDEDLSVRIDVIAEEGTAAYQTTIDNARPLAQTLVIGGELIEPSPTAAPVVQGVQTTPTITPQPTTQPNTIPPVGGLPTTVSILNPKEDAHLRFAKPLFRGEGIPAQDVRITLDGSIKQNTTVIVQEDGMWLWTPPVSLEAGPYTLTIATTDANNHPVSRTRTFTIAKSGQQVLSSSTPSATISPEIPMPTTPVIIEQPTPTPVIFTPTPTPDLPVTAHYGPSMVLIAAGFLLVILSFALL